MEPFFFLLFTLWKGCKTSTVFVHTFILKFEWRGVLEILFAENFFPLFFCFVFCFLPLIFIFPFCKFLFFQILIRETNILLNRCFSLQYSSRFKYTLHNSNLVMCLFQKIVLTSKTPENFQLISFE